MERLCDPKLRKLLPPGLQPLPLQGAMTVTSGECVHLAGLNAHSSWHSFSKHKTDGRKQADFGVLGSGNAV